MTPLLWLLVAGCAVIIVGMIVLMAACLVSIVADFAANEDGSRE